MKTRFPFKIQWKIALLAGGLILAAMGISAALFIPYTSSVKTEEAKSRFINIATILGSIQATNPSLSWKDYQSYISFILAQEYSRRETTLPILYIALFDQEGAPQAYGVDFTRVKIRDPQGKLYEKASPALIGILSSEKVPDLKKIRSTLEGGNAVEIGYSLKPLKKELFSISLFILGITLALILLSILASGVLARLITRPVSRLTEAMEKVSQGDFTQKVAITSRDEIGFLTENFNGMTQGLLERERIKEIFSKYVSKQVAHEILKKKDEIALAGEKRRVTILFSDIRGFTALAEELPPEEVVSLLNEYFTLMVDIIFKYDGVLDKFIGDAIMAYWNAPIDQESPSRKAALAAFEMQQAIEKLNETHRRQGKKEIHAGIGINSGEAVAGNLGSVKKMEYTVIGDHVNLAQRIEAQTQRDQIVLSESVLQEVKNYVKVEELGLVRVKGREEPVRLYLLKDVIRVKENEPQNL